MAQLFLEVVIHDEVRLNSGTAGFESLLLLSMCLWVQKTHWFAKLGLDGILIFFCHRCFVMRVKRSLLISPHEKLTASMNICGWSFVQI